VRIQRVVLEDHRDVALRRVKDGDIAAARMMRPSVGVSRLATSVSKVDLP
jgi:hypothetical protein